MTEKKICCVYDELEKLVNTDTFFFIETITKSIMFGAILSLFLLLCLIYMHSCAMIISKSAMELITHYNVNF